MSRVSPRIWRRVASYCARHQKLHGSSEGFEAYLDSSEGKKILTEISEIQQDAEAGIDTARTDIMTQVTAAITDAVTTQVEQQSAAIQTRLEDAMAQYMGQAMQAIGTQMAEQVGPALEAQIGFAMENLMGQLTTNMSNAMSIDEDKFTEAFSLNMSEEELSELMMSMMTVTRVRSTAI